VARTWATEKLIRKSWAKKCSCLFTQHQEAEEKKILTFSINTQTSHSHSVAGCLQKNMKKNRSLEEKNLEKIVIYVVTFQI
jgi:hypothetical protein